jgi:hypothetical protein
MEGLRGRIELETTLSRRQSLRPVPVSCAALVNPAAPVPTMQMSQSIGSDARTVRASMNIRPSLTRSLELAESLIPDDGVYGEQARRPHANQGRGP